MIEINRTPLMAMLVPPTFTEEAAARITELTVNGLEGLIFAKFATLEQFRTAMMECRLLCGRMKAMGKLTTVQLWEVEVYPDGDDGYWKVILRQAGDYFVDVIQVERKEK